MHVSISKPFMNLRRCEMKVKVSEAKGRVLDYLVAQAMGMDYRSKRRWMRANYGEFNKGWFEQGSLNGKACCDFGKQRRAMPAFGRQPNTRLIAAMRWLCGKQNWARSGGAK
jgi:hypothetical protein